jgi:hypothetical protein
MGYPRRFLLERKYKQRGYQDHGKPEKKQRERPPQGPPHKEQIGPRTPRMVGTVTRARCTNCGAVLVQGFDLSGQCPRCASELHCCKQCVHFDTAARFECTQPIPERIGKKDARNECTFFEFRVTIEKDTAPSAPVGGPPSAATNTNAARPNDARKAFDDLFKK